ncbi:MAG TPA: hypothetical protein VHD76_08590 [Bryobacteraceae bacterium]|nr:hypothetical protein [Bryobacteraceae bacterium]
MPLPIDTGLVRIGENIEPPLVGIFQEQLDWKPPVLVEVLSFIHDDGVIALKSTGRQYLQSLAHFCGCYSGPEIIRVVVWRLEAKTRPPDKISADAEERTCLEWRTLLVWPEKPRCEHTIVAQEQYVQALFGKIASNP